VSTTVRPDYRFVDHLWDDEVADQLDPLARLVYRSNLLGADPRITNTGGGNTSSKLTGTDPLTSEETGVLWVKGSGGDLRTSARDNFASLRLDALALLEAQYRRAPDKGVKSDAEDRMVELYRHAVFGLNPRAASIDTPLHGLLPARHVDHTHPHAVIALAAAKDGPRLTREIYGDEVAWLGWQRPGFDLGVALADLARANPGLRGVILGQHGLINWHDDDRACYELTLELIERAASHLHARDRGADTFGGARHQALPPAERRELLVQLLPLLRGLVSEEQRMIATVQDDDAVLRFVNSADLPRLAALGTSCPDHFLRTKIKPLRVDWDPASGDSQALQQALRSGLQAYRQEYAAYYQAHRRPESPAMRDPNPTVILIPGLGMIAFGRNKSESRVTAEFYTAAVEVMRGAEAVSTYRSLPLQEAFDIEYWALEEAKLQRMPAGKEFARRVVVVVGAGSGIGRAVAERLAHEGAHVVCADVDSSAAQQTAAHLEELHGQGIGVAGSGISACGPAIGVQVDITQRDSVRQLFSAAVLAYGGIDSVIVTAGIFAAPDANGHVPDDSWAQSFAVNVTGSYLVADEARRIWDAQGLPGSLVLTTSVNATVAKKGSLAYDTSKAATSHLIRELAVELAPGVRVNGLAPATVVAGSSMFPRERVIASLRKYGLPFAEDASTQELREILSRFYAARTLTGSPVTLADQAEAAYLLAGDRLSRTTGQILVVDGGLHEAFLR
jgi:rhamnulose-1-phosphate aldolase/alcohol dehydrogenase